MVLQNNELIYSMQQVIHDYINKWLLHLPLNTGTASTFQNSRRERTRFSLWQPLQHMVNTKCISTLLIFQ